MKTLQCYIQESQTELLNNTNSFFAFGIEQFKKQKIDGVKYTQYDCGIFCPTENCEELEKGLESIHKKGIEKDVEENGMSNIIIRELYNHESFYTNCIDSTVEALQLYPFTIKDIRKTYYSELAKQN